MHVDDGDRAVAGAGRTFEELADSLTMLADRPTREHVEVFEEIHTGLVAQLALAEEDGR